MKKHARFFIVDAKKGELVWMKPHAWRAAVYPQKDGTYTVVSDPVRYEGLKDLHAVLEALDKTAIRRKRERLVGVCRRANQVWSSSDAERAFVLSTDSTQVYRSSISGAFALNLSSTSYTLHSLIALCCYVLHSLLTAP